MRSIFLASAVAALALAASNARADEVEYPAQNVVFATASSSEPIVTPDVTYSGSHGILIKDAPGPGRSAVAAYDDVRYQDGRALPAGAPAPRDDHGVCRVALQSASCPNHG